MNHPDHEHEYGLLPQNRMAWPGPGSYSGVMTQLGILAQTLSDRFCCEIMSGMAQSSTPGQGVIN